MRVWFDHVCWDLAIGIPEKILFGFSSSGLEGGGANLIGGVGFRLQLSEAVTNTGFGNNMFRVLRVIFDFVA